MREKLGNIPWYYILLGTVAGFNFFSGALLMGDGKWNHGFDKCLIGFLFLLIMLYSWLVKRGANLAETTLAGWQEALDGWKEANERNYELEHKTELPVAGSSYEPYSFGKADQN